jgi:hypothetical protein
MLSTLAIVGGFFVGFLLTDEFVVMTRRSGADETQVVRRPREGTELLAIFVASSACGASEYPGLREALPQIREVLHADARRDNKLFVSVGVALDADPWVGIEFLREFGPFDEVLSGGSWLNMGSITFIVRDFPSRRWIPQLILVERDVELLEGGSILSVNERLVGRKIGADRIVRFAQSLSAR